MIDLVSHAGVSDATEEDNDDIVSDVTEEVDETAHTIIDHLTALINEETIWKRDSDSWKVVSCQEFVYID